MKFDLQKNSREAFRELFQYYYPRLMAYISSITEEDIAEDIVQDVFLYVWENRDKLSVGQGFHSYLFQAAYTRCLDYFKKNKTIEKYNSQAFTEYLEQYRKLAGDDCRTIEKLYSEDFYQKLFELLDKLPDERREVFILTYIKGLKAKEVAQRLSMPRRTVESHIYLAIKYLKKKMSRKDFFLLLFL